METEAKALVVQASHVLYFSEWSRKAFSQGSKTTLKREFKQYLSDRCTVGRILEDKKNRVKDDSQDFFRERTRRRVLNASNVKNHVPHDEIDAVAKVMHNYQKYTSRKCCATAARWCRFLSQLPTSKIRLESSG